MYKIQMLDRAVGASNEGQKLEQFGITLNPRTLVECLQKEAQIDGKSESLKDNDYSSDTGGDFEQSQAIQMFNTQFFKFTSKKKGANHIQIQIKGKILQKEYLNTHGLC